MTSGHQLRLAAQSSQTETLHARGIGSREKTWRGKMDRDTVS